MKISNFEIVGIKEVDDFILKNEICRIEKTFVSDMLKTVNVSFIAENINRLQSTLLCELNDSYVQQSQRYVSVDNNSYFLPELSNEDKKGAVEIIEECFSLYNRMSELKEGSFKGRPQISNYKYGIPIEDARYILPLAVKTNLTIAMSGNKLINLFELIYSRRYKELFFEFAEQITNKLPLSLVNLLKTLTLDDGDNKKDLSEFYKFYFDKIDNTGITMINSFDNLDLKTGLGAITSTSKKTPSERLKEWKEEAVVKSSEVTKRVLGYGHDSISEQARVSFVMMCSMSAYHQQIRHRLTTNYRERFLDILNDFDRKVVVPQSIENSVFKEEFISLVYKIKKYRLLLLEKYSLQTPLFFLLNCDQIKFTISTNAKMDVNLLSERLCNNSQWEIRNISTKKYIELKKLSNTLYEKALPSCVRGKCKEGKLSCGKQKEVRAFFIKKQQKNPPL